MKVKSRSLSENYRQQKGIAAGGEFIERPAWNRCPIKIFNYKITTKSPTEFRPLKPLLIANYSR